MSRALLGGARMPVALLRRALAAGVVTAGLAVSSASQGQGVAQGVSAALEQQFEAAFQQMLADPANLDKTFGYAELAIQVGDYEAAISALERMLLFNPDLPRVRLELGVLYFRLGSYAVARTYLMRAVEGENVPDDVRGRVAVYLGEIDKRLSRHRFAGSVYGGLRFQSNANAGPERDAISLFGAEATLDREFLNKTDWNKFISGSLRHTYDPQFQGGEVWESNFLLYGANQFRQDSLDLIFIEANSGPRLPLWPSLLSGASFRPYGLLNWVWLENGEYSRTFGGGVTLSKSLGPRIAAEVKLEHVGQDFKENAKDRPTADTQDGTVSEARLDLRYMVSADVVVTGTVGATAERADLSLHSNREFVTAVNYTHTIDPFLGMPTGRWTLSATGTLLFTSFHEPDPAVDPNEPRGDRETRVDLLASIPVSESWTIIATAQRTIVNSNFRNFSYNNTAATVGASWRF